MNLVYQGQKIRRSTGTTDKRLADAVLAKVRVKIIEGRFFDGLEEKDRTFAEMMERYLKERSVLKAAKSRERDEQCLKHLLPVFGCKTLEQVTPKLLAAYKAGRRQKAEPATINKELALVRHAFNIAIREWEWCRENPMRKVSLEPVRNEIDRWLTGGEETRLLAVSAPWLKEIIAFALHTGMRQGEILALQWQDVDFARGTVMVMKSKNRTRRTIPLNSTVFELLATKQAASGAATGLVFTTQGGTRMKPRYLGRAFSLAVERAGIEHFRFHDLRHTFATRLAQKSVDLYKVQRLLGHKTGVMTQRYAHHSPESLREGVRVLEESQPEGRITNLSQSVDSGVLADGGKLGSC
jgi:integrase